MKFAIIAGLLCARFALALKPRQISIDLLDNVDISSELAAVTQELLVATNGLEANSAINSQIPALLTLPAQVVASTNIALNEPTTVETTTTSNSEAKTVQTIKTSNSEPKTFKTTGIFNDEPKTVATTKVSNTIISDSTTLKDPLSHETITTTTAPSAPTVLTTAPSQQTPSPTTIATTSSQQTPSLGSAKPALSSVLPTASPTPTSTTHKTNAGAIAGGVVGGVAFCGVVGAIIYLLHYLKRHKGSEEAPLPVDSTPDDGSLPLDSKPM